MTGSSTRPVPGDLVIPTNVWTRPPVGNVCLNGELIADDQVIYLVLAVLGEREWPSYMMVLSHHGIGYCWHGMDGTGPVVRVT